ncbi:chorismate synthase [Streptomyces ambofaciens]
MSRLRWLTAGESHGPALVATLEGLPAGVPITTEMVADHLARRRLGYGRGARMKFERDEVTFLGGVRHGLTMGSPVAVMVGNTEWPKWEQVMAADPVDPEVLAGLARNAPLTRPRPGHADLAGMQKYGFDEARPILERASARETAARVALGAVARSYLKETTGVEIVSHVVELASAKAPHGVYPTPADVERLDADPVRCLDADASKAMVAEIDQAHKDGDTLGGVVEILAYDVPVGLGSHVHWDRKLDARLAGALMGIQAIKGVEIGDGFELARVPGSQAHDEIVSTPDGIRRVSGRSGGTEGGLTTGELLRVRAAMKPIATVPRALKTVDVTTGEGRAGPPPALRRVRGPRRRNRRRGHGGLGPRRRGGGEVRRRQRDRDPPQRHLLPRQPGHPMSAPLIVLVGPMGVGKSTVGQLLAERLGAGYRDTDEDIVTAQGRTIAEIFVDEGEAAFRALEKEAVRSALAEHDGVLALGGGAILDADTRALLTGQRVVYLSMDVEEAVKRTGLNAARPLLAVNPRKQWRELMEARRHLYEEVATAVVATDGRTPEEVTRAALDAVEWKEA